MMRTDSRFSTMLKWAAGCRDASASLLYPACCQVCGAPIASLNDGLACADCWQDTEHAGDVENACVKCGLPLPAISSSTRSSPDARQLESSDRRCRTCDEWTFQAARSCGRYAGALRETVLWLKRHPHLPVYVRHLLAAAYGRLPGAEQIGSVIPVPLHPGRQRERGFNQAEIIARALSASLDLPLNTASLIRLNATEKHRAGMDAQARAESLRGAFSVRAPRLVERQSVLLVDDVMTTGATADEIARTLLEGGARTVNVLTLARAVTHWA